MSPKKALCPGASLPGLLAALALLGLAGGAAAAEYSVKPEIQLEQNYDDNVQGADNRAGGRDVEVASWGTIFTPLVTLGRKTDKSEASLFLGSRVRKIYHLSELDGTDQRVEATLKRVLTQRLSIGARAKYEFFQAYDPIEEAQQILFAERPDLRWRSAGGDLTYVLDDLTQVKLDLDVSQRDYADTSRVDLYDTQNRGAELTLTRALSPSDKGGLILGASWSEETSAETVPGVPETRTEDMLYTYLGFWERSWSQRWTTTLQAGGRILDSDREDPVCDLSIPGLGCLTGYRTEDSSDSGGGFIGGGTVVYAYSPRGGLSLSYLRDTRTGTSSATGSSAIDVDVYSATLRHRLAKRLTLSLTGSETRYETTSDSRVTDFSGAVRVLAGGSETKMRSVDVRLYWQLRQELSAYASYRWFAYDDERIYERLFGGDVAIQRDYERRIFAVGFRYAFDLLDRAP